MHNHLQFDMYKFKDLMVKVMKSHLEMAEIKWVNLVYLVLLISGVRHSSQRELAAVKEEESYKQDNNINGEEKWGIGGGVGGGISIPGFTIGGDANGGIGIPGFNIGGDAQGGIGIPGFNIGGDVNGGVSGGGGIGVPGLGGSVSFGSGISGGGVSFGGGVARPCHVYDGKGVLVRKWLHQPQYWNGNALRGTGQSFDFGSSALNENASINDSSSNISKQDNNEHDINQKEAYENKGKTAEAVAPNSGWAYQNRN